MVSVLTPELGITQIHKVPKSLACRGSVISQVTAYHFNMAPYASVDFPRQQCIVFLECCTRRRHFSHLLSHQILTI